MVSSDLRKSLHNADLKTPLGSSPDEVHPLALGSFPAFLQLIMAEKTNQLEATAALIGVVLLQLNPRMSPGLMR